MVLMHYLTKYAWWINDFMTKCLTTYVKMLYYNKVDVSEGIGVNKTRHSKECDIRHFWYF